MKSRQLEVVEAALVVAALRTHGNMIGVNRELCHSLSREFMQGYVFVTAGSTALDVQEGLELRTLESDLEEDRC